MDDHLHGATTTGRLKADGVGKRGIAGKVARGELSRVRRRLFVHAAAQRTSEQVAAIGLLAVDERGVVTGSTSLRWAGYDVPDDGLVHITVEEGVAVPNVPGVCYRRTSHMEQMRAVQHQGLNRACDAWSMLDVARDLSARQTARAYASAIGAKRMSIARLEEELAVRPRFNGRARARRTIAALKDEISFSGTEKAVARALRGKGFEVVLNHPVLDGGRILRKADIAIPELRYDLEVDGPHHWLPEQAAKDRRIDTRMRQLDWTIDRVPVYDVDDGVATAVRVVEISVARLRRRGARP